jgi:hypothetical protein
MYFYKVWGLDFIEHARSPHSILSQFLDRGLSGWWAQNWASVVSCATNSTERSMIYKLTSELADYRNLSKINNVCYISLEITSTLKSNQ